MLITHLHNWQLLLTKRQILYFPKAYIQYMRREIFEIKMQTTSEKFGKQQGTS